VTYDYPGLPDTLEELKKFAVAAANETLELRAKCDALRAELLHLLVVSAFLESPPLR